MASIAFHNAFGTDEQCRAHLFAIRWPDGAFCPSCEAFDPYQIDKGARFKCRVCRHKFSLTSGTLFDNSKMPLHVWYYCIHVFASARKRVSSVQLAKDMGVTQTVAYKATMKLRSLLGQFAGEKLTGTVEVDEGFFGSQWSGYRTKGQRNERMVLGLKERGGDVRLIQVPDRSIATLQAVLKEHVQEGASVNTDGWVAYKKAANGFDHASVNHKEAEWVRGTVSTNDMEAIWGRMKRSIRYAHHNVQGKTLQAYCDEFAFKENTREFSDEQRFEVIVRLAALNQEKAENHHDEMAKRFIDTDLFRKPLVRGLGTPYKLLWIYLLCECDHAGVWDVEIDVASMRLGTKLDAGKCIAALGSAIVPIDGGRKWWIPEFVAFQYGHLNPANRVHASVISGLAKYGIDPNSDREQAPYKPLTSPLQGAKDMDKDKDKDKDGVQGKEPTIVIPAFLSEEFALAWAGFETMRRKKGKAMTDRARALILSDLTKMGEADAILSLNASTRAGWTDVYPPKDRKPTPTDRVNATLADPTKPIETVKEYNARLNAQRHGKPEAAA